MQRLKKKLGYLLIVFLSVYSIQGQSAPEDEHWTVSIQFGAHAPNLQSLQKLYQAPTIGIGTIENVDEIGNNVTEQFTIASPLTGSSAGGKTALTFLWNANASHSIIFGLGSWEATAFGVSTINIPIQGQLRELFYERRAKFSYTEFSAGWRYNFMQLGKFNFYSRLSFHEIFDLDYRDDTVFTFFEPNGDVSFRRIIVMEAQTGALLMGEAGVGVEWRLSKWFGLGIESTYLKAERSVQLRGMDTRGIGTIESIQNGLPYGNRSDGTVGYLAQPNAEDSDARYQPLNIDMSGLQILFSINIQY